METARWSHHRHLTIKSDSVGVLRGAAHKLGEGFTKSVAVEVRSSPNFSNFTFFDYSPPALQVNPHSEESRKSILLWIFIKSHSDSVWMGVYTYRTLCTLQYKRTKECVSQGDFKVPYATHARLHWHAIASHYLSQSLMCFIFGILGQTCRKTPNSSRLSKRLLTY